VKPKQPDNRIRINEGIKARELRVISEEGNLGVMSLNEALVKAEEMGLDLIEISPDAVPPVAKIMDYGKFQYEQKKRENVVRAKARASSVEVKNIQVKVGTGDSDLAVKAKQASEWLGEGHRVKVELFLKGRSKGMTHEFFAERIERFLEHLNTSYSVVEPMKPTPKGVGIIVEKSRIVKE